MEVVGGLHVTEPRKTYERTGSCLASARPTSWQPWCDYDVDGVGLDDEGDDVSGGRCR